MKILILGANGMLGNACMNYFANNFRIQVSGVVRSESSLNYFQPHVKEKILPPMDIADENIQLSLLKTEKPDVVINCVGVVKQSKAGNDFSVLKKFNTELPHRLAQNCSTHGVRMFQISTDCVFSGSKGSPYLESDQPDPVDSYGKSKLLGEIVENPHVLTLRTSYIGNELCGANGLLEWFLSQSRECDGYTRAIYSGMPTVILMKAIENIVLNFPKLYGLYHVASTPISKYNLLKLISQIFSKNINVVPNDSVVVDRSLDGSLFREKTGFVTPEWEQMIEEMYLDRIKNVQK